MSSRQHRSYLELAAQTDAVPYARRCTRQTLAAWQLDYAADATELVASELVTNAIAATLAIGAAAPVALYLALADDRLFVLVWDISPDLPVHRGHDDDAETGRGLEIVQELTDQWGTCVPVNGGKCTWARLDLTRR